MTSVLAKRMQLHNADFRFKNVFGRKICRRSALRSSIFFANTEVMQDLDSTLLYIMILRTYQIRDER